MAYNKVPFEGYHGEYEKQLERLQPLSDVLIQQALSPQGGDARITACMIAAWQKIQDPEQETFRAILIDDLMNPKAAGYGEPRHAALKLVRAIQSPLLKKDNRKLWNYPQDANHEDFWGRAIDWIIGDDMLRNAFSYDLFMRLVSSNKPQRYVSIPIITGMLRDQQGRPEEPFNVLDLGCSLNMGLGKLASGSPFSPITVVKELRKDPEEEETDEETTELFNRYAREYTLGHGVGVDIALLDRQGKWWAMSNCGYPSEWLDDKLETEFEYIHEAEDRPNVERVLGDITNPGSLESQGIEPKSYDVVSIMTTAYEMSPQDRVRAWRTADYFVKDDGLVISQEFGAVSKSGAFTPFQNMFDNPGKYRTAIKDHATQQARKVPNLRWENGRCKKVQLDVGALAMLGANR